MAAPIIIGSVLAYTALLFAIAYWGDRREASSSFTPRYWAVYGLSFAVYCTSWTFYGAVGTAEARGWEYLPIYLGPLIVFSVGLPVVTRMVEIGKRIHTTSIADFLSAHYGKSQALAALVAAIAVIGALPYIALQLKSVTTTFAYLNDPGGADGAARGGVFLVAIVLAAFAVLFGTRHIDITRHNRGMVAAIAFDSIVKLVALLAVGLFALALNAGGAADVVRSAGPALSAATSTDRFVTLTLLSMAAILCLPRQFHVAVVECRAPGALKPASTLFCVYLIAISLLVLPIAEAGLTRPELAGVAPDLFVLALPIANGADALALFVFVGGFAAATGMVIVASVALSTMVANDLIAPFLLRADAAEGPRPGFGARLLFVRRASIAVLMLIAALVAAYAPEGAQLASFGILSFAAAAQFAPALIGALYWRRARLVGAAAGMTAGFAAWVVCLLIPSYLGEEGDALGLLSLLDFTGWDSLTRGVFWSLGLNTAAFVLGSLYAPERAAGRTPQHAAPTTATAGDLYLLIERCLGGEQAGRVIADFEVGRDGGYDRARSADAELIAFTDKQISKAIGASSASILLRSVVAGGALRVQDVATLLGETTGKVSFSQELLQTTLENVAPGVSVVDKDLKLVAWNDAYVEMYDYPPGFIYEGRPIGDLIRHNARRGECGPGDVEDHVRRRLQHLRRAMDHAFERIRPNGMVVKIEGVRSPSGAYVTTFTDVSDYKRIEKALIDSERSIRFYTDNIPAMIAFADNEERVRFANIAYRETLCGRQDDIIGVPLADALGAAAYAERKPFIEEALQGRKARFDIEIEEAGERRCMQVSYVPQFRADGAVRGFFGLYQDVTARRSAEEALERTNETLEERVEERTRALSTLNAELDAARRDAERATASKTRFLAAASHDVLQPLNAARLFASALAEEAGAGSDAADLAGKIDSSIASADRLLRSLLNISKLDAGGLQPEYSDFPLQAVLDDLTNEFAMAAAEKGLRFSCASTGLWVRSDRGLLFSALQNLVSNAVRYTDEGRVLIGARRAGDTVRVEVRDTGRGVPEDRKIEIFEEFRRLDRDAEISGAGLGLATVDRIARLLSLPLALRSKVGAGSTFSLTAPRAEAAAESAAPPPARAPLDGLVALCIDNDQTVLESMEAALGRWGATALTARSDEDALVKYGADLPPPDLLILDYQLDRGRTGFDVLQRFDAIWPRRPFTIMITASASGAAEARAAREGVAVLAKPVEPAELRALIGQMRRQAAE
ncbi:MAG: PAS-domain containing protein [Pseudomonadota bacterium]